ncbi:MAG: HAD family phosphatase [Desulfoprunum sp.]|nr:HAD family phosphatase [Desulfoprunum sp.]
MIQIKAILIDIGGVLWKPRKIPFSDSWAARCGVSAEAFDQIVYNSEWGAQALTGNISGDEMWAIIGERLGLSHAERKECEKEYWAGIWDIEFLDYCRTLKPRYKFGIVSDADSNAREIVKIWINEALFDVIVFSSDVGACKPNPLIFHCALEQLGVDASATVFIDDRRINVNSAKELGAQAIHYKNRNQVLAALKEYISHK